MAVIEHPGGLVIVDTGHSPRAVAAARRGLGRITAALLPGVVRPDELIPAQLAGDDRLRGQPITDIVLTHLHPDHVGGLVEVLESGLGAQPRVVVDKDSVRNRRAAGKLRRLRRGWVREAVPEGLAVTDPGELPFAETLGHDPLGAARDLLGDGSVLVVPLPGHHEGHLGVLVRALGGDGTELDLLLIGDAAWDLRALTHGEVPAAPARLLMADQRAYAATIRRLGELATARGRDLIVLPTHDERAITAARARLAS